MDEPDVRRLRHSYGLQAEAVSCNYMQNVGRLLRKAVVFCIELAIPIEHKALDKGLTT